MEKQKPKRRWIVEYDRNPHRIIVWRKTYRFKWWARLMAKCHVINWPEGEASIFADDSDYAKTSCKGKFDR